jgi:AcrR family transcriptional regulator
MSEADPQERAARALLELAPERPWREISLREVAGRAGLDLADLFRVVRGKEALVSRISRDLDLAALRTAATPSDDLHDRLFDAVMARVEAMEPHRAALIRIAREAAPLVAVQLPATARALLEAAGVPATAPRLLAMTLAWARIAEVWRDDEGALNRTMAEIDKRLRQMRAGLARIRAGF